MDGDGIKKIITSTFCVNERFHEIEQKTTITYKNNFVQKKMYQWMALASTYSHNGYFAVWICICEHSRFGAFPSLQLIATTVTDSICEHSRFGALPYLALIATTVTDSIYEHSRFGAFLSNQRIAAAVTDSICEHSRFGALPYLALIAATVTLRYG